MPFSCWLVETVLRHTTRVLEVHGRPTGLGIVQADFFSTQLDVAHSRYGLTFCEQARQFGKALDGIHGAPWHVAAAMHIQSTLSRRAQLSGMLKHGGGA